MDVAIIVLLYEYILGSDEEEEKVADLKTITDRQTRIGKATPLVKSNVYYNNLVFYVCLT